MNHFITYCAVFLFSLCGLAQNGSGSKSIGILPSSELSISGDTNINEFRCEFNTFYLEQCTEVVYHKSGNHISFKNAVLTLRNEGFDCGSRGINKDFHALLNTARYPKITLELTGVTVENNRGKASVTINIAGKENSYRVPIEIITSPMNRFTGRLKLDIRDFGLEPPKKLLGLIVIKEDIEIDFNLAVDLL